MLANKKVVLNANQKVLAKEIGIARYERIKDFDWKVGEDYWKNTQNFWRVVREAWNKKLGNSNIFKLQSEVDGEILFSKLFMMADQYAQGEEEVIKDIQIVINKYSINTK